MKALRADPLSIGQIFASHEFIIPDFQRPYSWGVEECEQLWIDISSFLDSRLYDAGANDNREQYFLGSIVVYPDKEDENIWVVIDGQQRLTTLLILVKLWFGKAGTHIVLEKMLYKTDPNTTEIIKEKPRLVSRVLAGCGQDDYKDFQKVLHSETDDLSKNNPYKLNYNVLSEKLNEWWGEKTVEQRQNVLKWFQKSIVMLPIVCDSLDDALTLFQIINDRGMSLNDADIFKAQIYGMSEKQQDRENFIKRWSTLDEHETLFRIHMHIIRARDREIGKEIGLRSYIQKYFKSLTNPKTDCNSIVCSLESYHAIRTKGAIHSGEFANEEKIFWAILEQYPNIYWWYPLYVFLDKYGKEKDGYFYLEQEKQKEYIDLMKDTIRYFFIKGVLHNAVNFVKDTTFKVCAAIAHGDKYIDKYRENIGENGLADFKKKLSKNDYGRRYRKGLVWLCSSLNSNQNRADYAKTIENCHSEHILPWQWANYDGWDDKSHEENIEKIGNSIPLEWKLNIQAGAEFFRRKQDRYKESKIQDALDLSQKAPPCWFPECVNDRQTCSLNRLHKFFDAIS